MIVCFALLAALQFRSRQRIAALFGPILNRSGIYDQRTIIADG